MWGDLALNLVSIWELFIFGYLFVLMGILAEKPNSRKKL